MKRAGHVVNVATGGSPFSAMAPKAQSIGTLPDGRELVRMLCEVTVEEAPASGPTDAKPPAWIQLMPIGPIVEARDGRTFQVTDVLKVAAKTELPLVVDWDHESEWGKTRAAGWIEELRIQDGDGEMPRPGVWGRTTWTPEGKSDVGARAYRFLSPVLILESESRDAQQIVSVALTNRPALRMHGLDSFRERLSQTYGPLADATGDTMDAKTVSAIKSAFGLKPEADDAAIMQAATHATTEAGTLREVNGVLKAQLSEAQGKVATLEGKLAEQTKVEFAAQVERVLAQAATDGKVTPASATKWREFCLKGADNLALFERDILPDLVSKGGEAPPPPKSEGGKVDRKLAAYGISAEEAAAAEKYNTEQRASAGEEA